MYIYSLLFLYILISPCYISPPSLVPVINIILYYGSTNHNLMIQVPPYIEKSHPFGLYAPIPPSGISCYCSCGGDTVWCQTQCWVEGVIHPDNVLSLFIPTLSHLCYIHRVDDGSVPVCNLFQTLALSAVSLMTTCCPSRQWEGPLSPPIFVMTFQGGYRIFRIWVISYKSEVCHKPAIDTSEFTLPNVSWYPLPGAGVLRRHHFSYIDGLSLFL